MTNPTDRGPSADSSRLEVQLHWRRKLVRVRLTRSVRLSTERRLGRASVMRQQSSV